MRALLLVLLLLLAPLPAHAAPTPDFLSLEPQAPPRFEDLSWDQWKAISEGEDPMEPTVDVDFYPLGDANGNGNADIWEASWGENEMHRAITAGGKQIWNFTPSDSEVLLTIGDANRDGVLDFAVLDWDTLEFTILDGRDLSTITVLHAAEQRFDFGFFVFLFITFPTVHPDLDGYLMVSSHIANEGGHPIYLEDGLVRYGHDAPRHDLTFQHIDLDGALVWERAFQAPYTEFGTAGSVVGDDGMRDWFVAEYVDPDNDHLVVADMRPLDQEPEESLRIHRLDLATGETNVEVSVDPLDHGPSVRAFMAEPNGRPALVVQQWSWDRETFLYDSRIDLMEDRTVIASLSAPNDILLAESAGDLDEDGNEEIFVRQVFNERLTLHRGSFEPVWTSTDLFSMGLDLDGDGHVDLGTVNDDETEVTFLTALEQTALWTLPVVEEEIVNLQFVDDMDGRGDADIVLIHFPGADGPEDLHANDGYIELLRGSDGASFWERNIYRANSSEFPRLLGSVITSEDLDGDDAPDFLVNLEFIPRTTGFYCDNSGCYEEREEGEIYNLATALDGVHAKRLLRNTPQSDAFDAMGLDGTSLGEANDDLESNYAPGPAMALLVAGLAAAAWRRR